MRLRLLAAAVTLTAALGAVAGPASAFVIVPKPLAAPTLGITLGPDGNLWVSENNGSVQRMALDGTVLGTFDVGAQPLTVTTGPGGRVWVAVTGSDKLTWFDATSASPTAHDVSTAAVSVCGPIGLVAGGDGRMYFTMTSSGDLICGAGNLLSSVAADGTGIVTPGLGGLGDVFDLAAAGGKLYVPDNRSGFVRRVSLGLMPAIEATVTVAGRPNNVAADGAGNIWFTDDAPAGGVGRFPAASDGPATHLPPSGGALSAFGIVAGPDDDMYAAGRGSQNIARISPAGAFTFFPVPNAQPFDGANGADGDLWFTDSANARVLRFVNAAPRATTDAAVATSPSTAAATATVNPRGNDTSVVFEYGTTIGYGATTAPRKVPAGVDPVQVAGALSALTPSATYHVRVRAANAEGTIAGPDLTLTTPPSVPRPPPAVIPKLPVTISFGVIRRPTTTTLTRITLAGLRGGETATIRCTGSKKCAFRTRTYAKLRNGTRTFGQTLLKARRLPAGTTVTVQVTRARSIGTSVVFKVRRRRAPQISRRCLPPGATSAVTCT